MCCSLGRVELSNTTKINLEIKLATNSGFTCTNLQLPGLSSGLYVNTLGYVTYAKGHAPYTKEYTDKQRQYWEDRLSDSKHKTLIAQNDLHWSSQFDLSLWVNRCQRWSLPLTPVVQYSSSYSSITSDA